MTQFRLRVVPCYNDGYKRSCPCKYTCGAEKEGRLLSFYLSDICRLFPCWSIETLSCLVLLHLRWLTLCCDIVLQGCFLSLMSQCSLLHAWPWVIKCIHALNQRQEPAEKTTDHKKHWNSLYTQLAISVNCVTSSGPFLPYHLGSAHL